MATGNLTDLDAVAVELGLANEAAMDEVQSARAAALIPRVSELFAEAAQRSFAPGQYTHRLRVQYRSPYERGNTAWVQLTEKPSAVTQVVDDEGIVIPPDGYEVIGQELALKSMNYPHPDRFWGTHVHQSYFVTVTFTHNNPVPPAVKQTVAAIVARYISLQTTAGAISPVATSLSDALGNRVAFADWVTQSVQLLPDDVAMARRYRPQQPSIVVGT